MRLAAIPTRHVHEPSVPKCLSPLTLLAIACCQEERDSRFVFNVPLSRDDQLSSF
jgi:hypothetical protein